MSCAIRNILVAVTVGQTLVGGFTNGFIVLVNFMNWVKTGRVYSMDLILITLAISRIILLGSFTTIIIVLNFFFDAYVSGKLRYIEPFWNLSNHLNAWFGTCLSLFYFLKIANFSHPAFLWLKWRANKVILRMIFICFLIALFINIPLTEKTREIYKIYAEHGNMTNGTHKRLTTRSHDFFSLALYYLGGFVPFIVSLISCFLLVFSLWRHTRQMQGNATTSRDSSTEVHKKTIKSIVFFLFLFLLYHVGIITGILNYIFFESILPSLFSMTITAIYPLAHSIILIKMNNKLRQAFLRILWQHCPQRIWKSFCDIG
ncbi:taste receptor type 2 member 7-like [Sarcophilus harrisii]|uniref:taste receptor type 2 member 7-like n=1 Tax=Sarcophilus harrisii TaxID=9305 RepID=UPI00062B918B|nr:taste receptor type 2 member 7-like [Sarcophilus harrisii]